MKKYEILAKFDANGQQVGCGYIEAETAVNAIIIIFTEKFDDLLSANEITAYNPDDELTATAYFASPLLFDGDDCEIHVYANGNDIATINTKLEDK